LSGNRQKCALSDTLTLTGISAFDGQRPTPTQTRLLDQFRTGRWTACSVAPNLFSTQFGVEMSNAELSDHQLLDKAKTALRQKDGDRAKGLFTEYSKRSVARHQAKVANDPA